MDMDGDASVLLHTGCVPGILISVQNSANRNGQFQSVAQPPSAWQLLWCVSCPSGDCRLTRSHDPLPPASIRTGLCISLTWKEPRQLYGFCRVILLSPYCNVEKNPKVGTGCIRRDRPVIEYASVFDSPIWERTLVSDLV